MADFSQTVANTLSIGGGEQPTRWGNTANTTMTWGTDKWLYGSEDLIEYVIHYVEGQTLTLDASVTQHLITTYIGVNTLTLASDPSSETLTDRSGSSAWFYIFPPETTNGESRVVASYTTATGNSATYATVSQPSTTWS